MHVKNLLCSISNTYYTVKRQQHAVRGILSDAFPH